MVLGRQPKSLRALKWLPDLSQIQSYGKLNTYHYHKGGEIAEIVDKFNGKILYLPPYSPDFNPIEQCWFVLKNTAKKLRSQGVTLNDAIDHAFNSM